MNVQVEQVIDAPRDLVARFAMAPENEPLWIGGIKSSRHVSGPIAGVGMTVERVASFLGRRIEYALQVEEYAPGERIVMRSVRGPFPMRVTYAFEDAGAGPDPADDAHAGGAAGAGGATRVINRVEGEAGGFYGLAGPLMAAAVRRNLQRDLKTLRRLMEETWSRDAARTPAPASGASATAHPPISGSRA